MNRFSPMLGFLMISCELSTNSEKDPEGDADYDCSLTITSLGENGEELLLESSTELSCISSEDKTEYMEETCALDISNYDDYENVECDWSCSVIQTCSEE